MPSCPLGGQSCYVTRSRLGQALLRLEQSLLETREQEQRMESLLSVWEQSWSARREQMTRQLEIIETQLNDLSGDDEIAPQLSLVSGPDAT
ncbi:MAG: hypothetical protein ACREJB_05400 [Planctomycetaceae bacterium]